MSATISAFIKFLTPAVTQAANKVGRPKGVGCATRGYGKAMKRGK